MTGSQFLGQGLSFDVSLEISLQYHSIKKITQFSFVSLEPILRSMQIYMHAIFHKMVFRNIKLKVDLYQYSWNLFIIYIQCGLYNLSMQYGIIESLLIQCYYNTDLISNKNKSKVYSMFLYPPQTKFVGGGIQESPCPSVCVPSVFPKDRRTWPVKISMVR